MEARTVINIQDPVGKVVGKRRPPKDALAAGLTGQSEANRWLQSFGHRLAPKGVFRFHSHEEADAWMRKHIRPKKVG